MDRLWRSNSSINSRTGCPLDIVNNEDHNVESCGATVLMCLHGTKSKNLKNNILSMANVSLNDHVCLTIILMLLVCIEKLLKKGIMINLLTPTLLPLIILTMLTD